MSTVPVGQKSWSPTKAVLQWWRDWTRRSAARLELKCRGEDEVERMAKDVGVSTSELRRLASLGPDSADLLLHRMAALTSTETRCRGPNLERSKTFSAFAQCVTIIAAAGETLRVIPVIRHGRIIARTPRRSWR